MEPKPEPFEMFNLSPALNRAINEVGYETPTPVQLKTIPPLLEGRDVIGQAQTGTGKTAAFALPILEKLEPRRREVQALVLTPTRELGIQVAEAFHTFGKYDGDRGDRHLRPLQLRGRSGPILESGAGAHGWHHDPQPGRPHPGGDRPGKRDRQTEAQVQTRQ
jgi:superfamily II DNA/RNA helicase